MAFDWKTIKRIEYRQQWTNLMSQMYPSCRYDGVITIKEEKTTVDRSSTLQSSSCGSFSFTKKKLQTTDSETDFEVTEFKSKHV